MAKFVAHIYPTSDISSCFRVGQPLHVIGPAFPSARAAQEALLPEYRRVAQRGFAVSGLIAELDDSGILRNLSKLTGRADNPSFAGMVPFMFSDSGQIEYGNAFRIEPETKGRSEAPRAEKAEVSREERAAAREQAKAEVARASEEAARVAREARETARAAREVSEKKATPARDPREEGRTVAEEVSRVAREAERAAAREASRVAREAEREASRVAREAEREAAREASRVAREAERGTAAPKAAAPKAAAPKAAALKAAAPKAAAPKAAAPKAAAPKATKAAEVTPIPVSLGPTTDGSEETVALGDLSKLSEIELVKMLRGLDEENFNAFVDNLTQSGVLKEAPCGSADARRFSVAKAIRAKGGAPKAPSKKATQPEELVSALRTSIEKNGEAAARRKLAQFRYNDKIAAIKFAGGEIPAKCPTDCADDLLVATVMGGTESAPPERRAAVDEKTPEEAAKAKGGGKKKPPAPPASAPAPVAPEVSTPASSIAAPVKPSIPTGVPATPLTAETLPGGPSALVRDGLAAFFLYNVVLNKDNEITREYSRPVQFPLSRVAERIQAGLPTAQVREFVQRTADLPGVTLGRMPYAVTDTAPDGSRTRRVEETDSIVFDPSEIVTGGGPARYSVALSEYHRIVSPKGKRLVEQRYRTVARDPVGAFSAYVKIQRNIAQGITDARDTTNFTRAAQLAVHGVLQAAAENPQRRGQYVRLIELMRSSAEEAREQAKAREAEAEERGTAAYLSGWDPGHRKSWLKVTPEGVIDTRAPNPPKISPEQLFLQEVGAKEIATAFPEGIRPYRIFWLNKEVFRLYLFSVGYASLANDDSVVPNTRAFWFEVMEPAFLRGELPPLVPTASPTAPGKAPPDLPETRSETMATRAEVRLTPEERAQSARAAISGGLALGARLGIGSR